MNICLLTSSFPARRDDLAQAPFVVPFIEGLKERGHRVFVFTQDRPWVQQYLPMAEGKFVFVSEKDPDLGAVKDLWLMTQCRHYVISNSTLHWWGAWFNTSQDKLVIAPEHGWGNRDILPPQWKTIGTIEP